jgi:arabinan endo-1,5-alpha-L-arabinosidase
MDRGGASVLDIRTLLWKDGWPAPGEKFVQGTYEIESVRTGTSLELAVEGVPVGGRRGRGRGGLFGGTDGVIPDQDVAEVSVNWPEGNVDVRMANYLCQAQQKWTVTPVADAGGTLGSPYFKITIAGTDRTLAVTEGAELVVLPTYTGGIEQLWRVDQFTDGTWRIMPKIAFLLKEPLALSAVGSSFATLSKFDPTSHKQRWVFKTP